MTAFIHWLMCFSARHQWIKRGAYRRICKWCPREEFWVPDEGWVA